MITITTTPTKSYGRFGRLIYYKTSNFKKEQPMAFVISRGAAYAFTMKTAGEAATFAAEELKSYLIRIFALKINDQAANSFVLQIREDSDLGDEGYRLKITATTVTFTGGGPFGLVHGVYDFLRRFCGCQFSNPGPDGEYIPSLDQLELEEGEQVRKPQLWYRGLQIHRKYAPDIFEREFDWMAKNGLNYVMFTPLPDTVETEEATSVDPATGEVRTKDTGNRYTNKWFRKHLLPLLTKRGLKLDRNHHNLLAWLPPEQYFAQHPEWYALKNGKRDPAPYQLCLCTSNAAMVAELIKNIKAYVQANPEVGIVGVIPEDGMGYCQCDQCLKMDGDDSARTQRLDDFRTLAGENKVVIRRYVNLLNQISRAVRKDFPSVRIGSAHYVDLQFPPEGVKLDENIVPWVAIYWRCFAHAINEKNCELNRFFADLLRKWRRVFTGKLITYSYYMGMNAQRALPYPIARNILEDWKFYKKLGIGGATIQSCPLNIGAYGLNYLAFARAGWEDDTNYEQLLDDYLLGMFGTAALAIKPLYLAFDRAAEKIKNGQAADNPYLKPFPPARGHLLPNGFNIVYFLDEIGLAFIKAGIKEALSLAKSGREQRQVRRFQEAVRYWELGYKAKQFEFTAHANPPAGEKEAKNFNAQLAAAFHDWQKHAQNIYLDGWAGILGGYVHGAKTVRKLRTDATPGGITKGKNHDR
jgi:hypothetical protein